MRSCKAAPAEQVANLQSESIQALAGVGPALAKQLEKLGIRTVLDMLFHLPSRYVDRTRIAPLGELVQGQYAMVCASVDSAHIVQGRRKSLLVHLSDTSGRVALRFYHFTGAQLGSFATGARVRAFGEARLGATGLEFYHPEYELIGAEAAAPPPQHLTPIYPATEGLTQKRLRRLAEQAVATLDTHPPAELLPREINDALGGRSLSEALAYAHFPPADASVEALAAGRHPCQLRLVFEELLAHHFALAQARDSGEQPPAPSLHLPETTLNAFLDALPFRLTGAQRRASAAIAEDLARAEPMLRLVQGDVGSGKTVVAALAALTALASNQQVAVVAPTEILAEQHRASFAAWLEPLGYEVVWLVGKLTAKQKREALESLASEGPRLAVGTHALFEEPVAFSALALVIIDEQHRFGVHQRLSLRAKRKDGLAPHQLVMTATPIPRTLAMTFYQHLALSVIDELPPGRQPIQTVLVPDTRRDQVIERVREALAAGRQVYWVCTLVEDSETLSARAAEATLEELRPRLPDAELGLVHGRLKPALKEAAMAAFKSGATRLLIATTVIEVGVDVPAASLMIIENPERLGLAQLHQLRGRVGRGSDASHCVLLYGSPLSNAARARLAALRESQDGFYLAEEDLRLRGPGELLGTRQTGLARLRLADLERDGELLDQVAEWAAQIRAHHPAIAKALVARWFDAPETYLQG